MTRRLYLDQTGDVFCMLDDEDYEWAIRWRWGYVRNSTRKKFYASRMSRGRRGTPQIRIYLHKEILKRSRKEQPTDQHSIGDHQDGDSLNNTRHNLEWRTHRQNSRNKFGRAIKEPTLDEVPF